MGSPEAGKKMNLSEIFADLKSERVKKAVLDTDAFNEIDDQFAIVYSYFSERIDLQAVYAAPFHNDNSTSYEDGMEKSYDEIIRVLKCCDPHFTVPVFCGSRTSVNEMGAAVESEAADHLIKLARQSDEIIYVMAIGAITNIASAVMKAPDIKNKICVIWLASKQIFFSDVEEFNLCQDYKAGQIMVNSGVPLLLCPAWNVVCSLGARIDLVRELKGHNPASDYLYSLGEGYYRGAGEPDDWLRVLWDIAAPAILDNPACAEMEIITAPVLTDERKYAFDSTRHQIMMLNCIDRVTTYTRAWEIIKKGNN